MAFFSVFILKLFCISKNWKKSKCFHIHFTELLIILTSFTSTITETRMLIFAYTITKLKSFMNFAIRPSSGPGPAPLSTGLKVFCLPTNPRYDSTSIYLSLEWLWCFWILAPYFMQYPSLWDSQMIFHDQNEVIYFWQESYGGETCPLFVHYQNIGVFLPVLTLGHGCYL